MRPSDFQVLNMVPATEILWCSGYSCQILALNIYVSFICSIDSHVQTVEFVGLNLRDSYFQRVGGTRGSVIKKPPCWAMPVSDPTAALPVFGYPQHLSLVRVQRKRPPRDVTAEPLRLGALTSTHALVFLLHLFKQKSLDRCN